MKREIMLVFAVAVLLGCIMPAMAACVNDEQIIMRMFSPINSHGALWNETNYTYAICYENHFLGVYAEANPHECNGTNYILSLSSGINAHAEFGNSYPIDVCYGALGGCEVRNNTGANSCTGGKGAIVYLSDLANAHISEFYSKNYNKVICCKGPTSPISITIPTSCAHYSDNITYPLFYGKNNCNNDIYYAVESDKILGNCGQNTLNCTCKWNDNNETCRAATTMSGDPNCLFECVIDVTKQTACIDGYKNISYSASVANERDALGKAKPGCANSIMASQGCASKEITIACPPEEIARMPFFGIWQFISALVIVMVCGILRAVKR